MPWPRDMKKPGSGGRTRPGDSPEPDLERAERLVLRMMAIPGRSSREGRMMKFIRSQLHKAGVPESALHADGAHLRSPFGGEVGNGIAHALHHLPLGQKKTATTGTVVKVASAMMP